jgi:hypothetical protein
MVQLYPPKFGNDDEKEAFLDTANLEEYDLTAGGLPMRKWLPDYEGHAQRRAREPPPAQGARSGIQAQSRRAPHALSAPDAGRPAGGGQNPVTHSRELGGRRYSAFASCLKPLFAKRLLADSEARRARFNEKCGSRTGPKPRASRATDPIAPRAWRQRATDVE